MLRLLACGIVQAGCRASQSDSREAWAVRLVVLLMATGKLAVTMGVINDSGSWNRNPVPIMLPLTTTMKATHINLSAYEAGSTAMAAEKNHGGSSDSQMTTGEYTQ